MTEFSMRPASPADAEAIAAIYAPIVRDTAIAFEMVPPSAEEMSRRIEKTLQTYPWLVATKAGAVAGYVYAGEHMQRPAYRWSVNVTAYVAQTARGQGVGRSLYEVLLEMLTAQGFRSAFAGIALPNAPSVALHEAVGFEALGVYRDVGYKLGRWRDVGWWRRSLHQVDGPPEEPTPFPRFRETSAFRALLG